ncbi:MAG: hypothetical protein WC695_08195 [Candidatus Omnitrophota bacterium]
MIKIIQAMIPVTLLILGWFLLWLFYLNRGSTKIHESTVVILGVIIGALLFVTQSESIDRKITTIYFLNNKEHKLFFFKFPILCEYHSLQNGALTLYKTRLEAKDERISFGFSQDLKPLIDLHACAILSRLSELYQRNWYVERVTHAEAIGVGSAYTARAIEDVKKDITSYSKDSLPENFKRNIFFQDFILFDSFSLPKGTKISYETDKNGVFSVLHYKKPLWFDIEIRFTGCQYFLGLGNTGYYTGRIGPKSNVFGPDDPAEKDYGHVFLNMECRATFFRWTAWNPASLRYKRWANNLFNELSDAFSWDLCENRLKEYFQIQANYGIIYKDKGKLE